MNVEAKQAPKIPIETKPTRSKARIAGASAVTAWSISLVMLTIIGLSGHSATIGLVVVWVMFGPFLAMGSAVILLIIGYWFASMWEWAFADPSVERKRRTVEYEGY